MRYYGRDVASIRREEYPLLNDVTYLDHAGTTLYAQSLIDQFAQDMRSNLFGNPHSVSPSSHLSTVRIEGVRERLLRFFNADPEHFDLVFVANATAAIKVVVDAFREAEEGFWFGYHRDAHTSIVGVRQLAKEARCFASDMEVEEWLQESGTTSHTTSLFAYPAQSNMNGHRTPLDWPGRIRKSVHQRTYTLLDAAAYVMTAPLDLSDADNAPDFTAMSFYKIFGFPDLGALIVRKSAGDILRKRRFFGGGTVDMVIALQAPWHAMKEHVLHEQLEDGTLPFHSIAAVDSSLHVFSKLFGTMENVSKHTCELALNLHSRLSALRHSNGQQVCHFYKDPTSQYGNAKNQGPTLAFNLFNAQGGWIGKSNVERLAILHNIHLRTGGVCNPGGIAAFCNLQAWEMRRNFSEGMRCGDDLDILGGKPTGIVRVSFGAMSSLDDVHKFYEFVQDMFVETSISPSVMTKPSLAIGGHLVVEKLRIFPVLGCAGWEVGQDLPWSIGSTGLSWDREWCIVSTDDGRPLDAKDCPALLIIQPYLDTTVGTLRLVANGASSSDSASDEITISLWDTPASDNEQRIPHHSDSENRPFDTYNSIRIQDFLTTHLGLPCTLARFQHPRKIRKDNHASNLVPAVTISISPILHPEHQATISSNITLALPPQSSIPSSFRYLRIGEQFFSVPDSPAGDSFTATHLPDSASQSQTSQDPTLSTSATVQFFTTQTATHELPLAKAIASSSCCATSICPVWHCRQTFPRDQELGDHLQIHVRKTRPNISAESVWAKKLSHTPSPSTSTTSTDMSGMTIGTMDTVDTMATDVSLMSETVSQRLVEKGTMDVEVRPVSLASTPASLDKREEERCDMTVLAAKKQKKWSVKILRRRIERALSRTRV